MRYRIFKAVLLLIFIFGICGCDAFARKFTRKKKYQEVIDPVLIPEEEAGLFYDNDTKYRNYFAYWRGWHDELIEAIPGSGRKRKGYAINQAIANLELMAGLLIEDGEKEIRSYIEKMEKIRLELQANKILGQRNITRQLSNIRLRVNKNLHYSKVKDWIKK